MQYPGPDRPNEFMQVDAWMKKDNALTFEEKECVDLAKVTAVIKNSLPSPSQIAGIPKGEVTFFWEQLDKQHSFSLKRYKDNLKRAIEESILIARTVDDTLQTDAELPAPERTPSEASGEEIPLAPELETEVEKTEETPGERAPQANKGKPTDAGQAAAEMLDKAD